MKKVFIISAVLLLLAGCGADAKTSLSNGDEALFTGPDITYTKQDLYESMKTASADNIVNDILERIAKKDPEFDMSAIETQYDELIAMYEEAGLTSYIIQQYGSLDYFKQIYIKDQVISSLNNIYAKENYDRLVSEETPVQMQVAQFASEEEALKCIEDVNNATTFDTAALNNNAQGDPSMQIYLDTDTTLPLEVKQYVNENENTGLSQVIPVTTTTTGADGNSVEETTYYVVNIQSRNVEEFKDEFISLMASNADTEEVKNYYLTNNEIAFFDQELYDLMTSEYEVLK